MSGADSSPACSADHARRHRGPGGGLWPEPPAGGGAGPCLRWNAHPAPEPEAGLAGLPAGSAVLAGGDRGPVRPHPPVGRRTGSHLPYGRGGFGRRIVLSHAQPSGAARAAVAGGSDPGAVAAANRPRPPGGQGWKKIFKKSKKPLPKLAELV